MQSIFFQIYVPTILLQVMKTVSSKQKFVSFQYAVNWSFSFLADNFNGTSSVQFPVFEAEIRRVKGRESA